MSRPVEVFFSYAHADEDLMHDVRRQLVVFDRQDIIRKWHDRLIQPGTEWRGQIDDRLQHSDIILLFISPHFFESDYCYDAEMTEALRRHDLGDARVIPIILRPCSWDSAPFARLQALPTDGRPISLWPNRDEACLNVADGVMRVVREIRGESVRPANRAGSASKAAAVEPSSVGAGPLTLDERDLFASIPTESRELLLAAAQAPNGSVHFSDSFGGLSVTVGDREFAQPGNARGGARARRAVQELRTLGLLEDRGGNGSELFVTDEGFRAADLLTRL